MAHSRRDFLKGTLSLMSFSLASPLLFNQGSIFAQSAAAAGKILVVVQLDGGNDGLNTVVPYTDKTYYSLRPTLGIPESSVLKVSDKYGFNPVMTKFKSLFDQGKIAVVQNTGYPTPDLSHFRSRVIYQRADPNTQEADLQSGWLGKYADLKLAEAGNPLASVNIGQSLPKSLVGEKFLSPSIDSFVLYQFQTDAKYAGDRKNQIDTLKKNNAVDSKNLNYLFTEEASLDSLNSSESLQTGIKNYNSTVTYPNNNLGKDLQMAAQIIAGNLGAQVIHITFGGFDTHSGQKADQEQLLTAVSEGFSAFYDDLTRLNKANDVLVMAFSEFGRRPKENGSQGTDHGTAGPMFIMGNSVKGGLYGESPSLTDLDRAGNVKFNIDFRSVYSTVISDWLQTDPVAVLGGKFENIGFINK
jgi:uncharacterized protein (DUF1501 family)